MRVVNPWNGLDEKSVAVEMVERNSRES